MRTTYTMSLVTCLMLTALVCRAAEVSPPAPVMVNDTGVWYRADVRVTEAAFGKTVAAKVGEWVDVSLTENPSTGMGWHRSWAPLDGLVEIRDVYVAPETQPGALTLLGAPGTRHFLLYVAGTGKYTVGVQYGQWWEHGQRQELRTFVIDSTGTPPGTLANEVTLKVGSTYEIVRSANSTTGFFWKCTWEPGDGLTLTRHEYVPKPHPQGMVGVGGTMYFSLRADKVGRYVVSLVYARGNDIGRRETQVINVVP
jgi:predicted secreted protein